MNYQSVKKNFTTSFKEASLTTVAGLGLITVVASIVFSGGFITDIFFLKKTNSNVLPLVKETFFEAMPVFALIITVSAVLLFFRIKSSHDFKNIEENVKKKYGEGFSFNKITHHYSQHSIRYVFLYKDPENKDKSYVEFYFDENNEPHLLNKIDLSQPSF